MDLIGYTCSYLPVELLSATGLRPYRLLHGEVSLKETGERLVKVDACPLVKSNLGYLQKNKERFRAVIGSTGCDMARRQLEIIGEMLSLPVYIFNNPRTFNPKIYEEEINELVDYLEKLSQRRFTPDLLQREIERWEVIRERFRNLDALRQSGLLSTAHFHQLCLTYHQGEPNPFALPPHPSPPHPRVYLLGSPLSYSSNQILELLETRLQIVGDFNCGLSRFLTIKIREKNLKGIVSAYWEQPPCPFKRPNDGFYQWVEKELKNLRCLGIIAWTLDYCDCYEFELNRIEERFSLPVLRLRSDFSFSNLSHLKLRISAFAESL
jgi:benzoyl-CoA reductase/2-hydroxyglutaryl-CoA dehydratase subunit BcrC/BadD/HgdB